jgi:exopolyphosphatase/guanosine-5'-triphosphate,3'-diphosphate pyrophosphatase
MRSGIAGKLANVRISAVGCVRKGAAMTENLDRRGKSRTRGKARSGAARAYAAIDLGTNNCRLLVARPDAADGFRVIDAFSRIVRLGEGLVRHERLSEAAMHRTIGALRICAEKLRRTRVVRMRGVATEACRRAGNCDDFLARVRERTGLDIETISSDEEVRLILQGCLPLFDAGLPKAILFDIGGGSTEVVWIDLTGATPEPIDWISMPFGVVTLADRFGGNPLSAERYRALMAEVDECLAPFCRKNGIAEAVVAGGVQMLGTSGTVTTLAGIQLALPRYDRSVVDGAYLGFEAISEISGRLLHMGCADRAAIPCIGVERADLVVAGCAVLEAVCERWPVGQLRVGDRGIREGILRELIAAPSQLDRVGDAAG